MNFYNFFFFYNYFFFNTSFIVKNLFKNFNFKLFFLNDYFLRNELVWQEGFLIDFLQKRIIDNWIKKFLIYSSYLFNERLVFDKLIKFYLDFLIWPLHKFSIFEYNNISNMLFVNVFFFIFTVFIVFFIFLFFLMF